VGGWVDAGARTYSRAGRGAFEPEREEHVDSANDWHGHYMTRAVTACGPLCCAQHSGLGFRV
jgi:hypothetical protein